VWEKLLSVGLLVVFAIGAAAWVAFASIMAVALGRGMADLGRNDAAVTPRASTAELGKRDQPLSDPRAPVCATRRNGEVAREQVGPLDSDAEAAASTSQDPVELAAVVAHGLSASIDIIVGCAYTLERHGLAMSADEHHDAVTRLREQAEFASGVLSDLVVALQSSILDKLDDARFNVHEVKEPYT